MSLQDMINESLKNQGVEQETPKTNPEAEKDVEKNKKPVETEDVEKNKKNGKKFTPSRGFKTLKEAEEFVESEAFNKWDNASKKEFKNWLEKVKED